VPLFLTADGTGTTIAHSQCMAIIEQNDGHIIRHTGLSSEDFLLLYQTTNTGGSYISSEGIHPLAQISRAADCVFVVSYDRYLQQHRENDLALMVKKIS
jgi:hypothetical protein